MARNRGPNTTLFLASMTLKGAMGEAMVLEGSTDRCFVFEAYIEHYFLGPTLQEGHT